MPPLHDGAEAPPRLRLVKTRPRMAAPRLAPPDKPGHRRRRPRRPHRSRAARPRDPRMEIPSSGIRRRPLRPSSGSTSGRRPKVSARKFLADLAKLRAARPRPTPLNRAARRGKRGRGDADMARTLPVPERPGPSGSHGRHRAISEFQILLTVVALLVLSPDAAHSEHLWKTHVS